MRNLIFIIFSFLFLFSCSDDKKHNIEALVKEWNNKEILFPGNPVFTRLVKDTVPYRIPKTDYKVVVFVDSVGCISCKLQLPKWKEFMHEVDSLSDGNVPFVFFFQTKDLRELRYILALHPVHICPNFRTVSFSEIAAFHLIQVFFILRKVSEVGTDRVLRGPLLL